MELQCIFFCFKRYSHTLTTLFKVEKLYCHTKKVKKCGDISMEINENTVKKRKG